MKVKFIMLTLVLASVIYSNLVIAHAEHDKARFVATNGVDQGQCDNPVRPCKTISYAVSQAAKGDKVLVAGGDYTLNNESELFYLKSQLVPVIGGYNRFDHFQVQSPDVNKTNIIGAPKELHDVLHQSGFKVIADIKSLEISASIKSKMSRTKALFQTQKNQTCDNGRAGSFSCNNVDLIAHVPLPGGTSGSDVWGHVDLNTNIEYAIMAYNDGTRIYSLANPSSPELVGLVSGINTSWRDIKVLQYYDDVLSAYQAYAYVTAESDNGIQIIDLNDLPNSVSLKAENFDVSSAHNVYISNVDYSLNLPLQGYSPKLQIVGSNKFGGAFTTFDLTNPIAPVSSYEPLDSLRTSYTHDATNMTVDDIRATRDCVNSENGRCDVFIDFNEDEIRVWDATDSADTTRLGTVDYDDVAKSSQYVHSGWWHENKRYVYVHDEFDENKGGLNTTVRILDLEDLSQPTVVGQWQGDNSSIDHNGFVKGNRYYMSNYERGLTILDISDPLNPSEVGYFDTFPSSNNASFNGAWGAYPYLPSGIILISDINSGLYVLKDNSRNELAQVNFVNTELTIERGETISLEVNKPSNLNQAASVDFTIINGSASIDQDMALVNVNQTLTWTANDVMPKLIELTIVDDGKDSKKDFFVKLTNASGNLQIGDALIAQVKINGLESQGKIGFVSTDITVSETQPSITMQLQRIGGSRGQVSVDFQLQLDSASAQDVEFNPTTITWLDGDDSNKSITISIVNDALEETSESLSISLINIDTDLVQTERDVINITITDDESNLAPEVYAGNDIELSTNATTTLANATVTDPEQGQVSYLWQHISGVNVSLTQTDQLAARVTATSATGDAIVRLTATDEHGATASSELTITVVAPPEPTKINGSGGSIPLTLLLALGLLSLRSRR